MTTRIYISRFGACGLMAAVVAFGLYGCNADSQLGASGGREVQATAERDALAKRLTSALAEIAQLRDEGSVQREEIRQLRVQAAEFRLQEHRLQTDAELSEKRLLEHRLQQERLDLLLRASSAQIEVLNGKLTDLKLQNAEMALLVTALKSAIDSSHREVALVQAELKTSRAAADAGGANEQVLAERSALLQRNSQLEQMLKDGRRSDGLPLPSHALVEQAREHSRRAYRNFRSAQLAAKARRTSASNKALNKASLALEQAQSELSRLLNLRGVHTVHSGETLISISAHYFRDARRWPTILEANRHLIDRADQVSPGLVLLIP